MNIEGIAEALTSLTKINPTARGRKIDNCLLSIGESGELSLMAIIRPIGTGPEAVVRAVATDDECELHCHVRDESHFRRLCAGEQSPEWLFADEV